MLDETTKLSKDQGKLIIKNYDLTEITSIMLLMANNQTISQSTSVHFENSKVSAITLLHIIGIMQKSDNKVKIDLTGCSFPELEIGEEIEKSYLESHRANTVMTTLELKGAWDTINITELRKLAGSIHQLIINTEIGFLQKELLLNLSGEKNVEIHIPKFSITIKSDQLTQDKIAELVDKATFLKRIASLLPPDEAHEENDIESSQEHDIKYYISTLVNSHADENNNNNVVATSHKQESAAKLKASITREIFKKNPNDDSFCLLIEAHENYHNKMFEKILSNLENQETVFTNLCQLIKSVTLLNDLTKDKEKTKEIKRLQENVFIQFYSIATGEIAEIPLERRLKLLRHIPKNSEHHHGISRELPSLLKTSLLKIIAAHSNSSKNSHHRLDKFKENVEAATSTQDVAKAIDDFIEKGSKKFGMVRGKNGSFWHDNKYSTIIEQLCNINLQLNSIMNNAITDDFEIVCNENNQL